MKTSTKFVLFVLAAAGLSAVMALPASAQVFKSRGQTCDNPSTARDKTQKPDYRCLRAPKEGPAFERWYESAYDLGKAKGDLEIVPGGPKRRDYVPAGGGSGGVVAAAAAREKNQDS
jgi:hypothetical protein